MKAYELIEWLNEHHPQKFAEDWDNVGLLVGDDQRFPMYFLRWILQNRCWMRRLRPART